MPTAAAARGRFRGAGASIAGAAPEQAARHFAWSIPSPQQPSGGADMLMLSQGASAGCAQALAAGPKASQKATSAAISGPAFTGRAAYQLPPRAANIAAELGGVPGRHRGQATSRALSS